MRRKLFTDRKCGLLLLRHKYVWILSERMINLSLFSDQVADSHENSIYHSYTNHSYIHDTMSHNSGNIHGENLHILAIEREKSFLEN